MKKPDKPWRRIEGGEHRTLAITAPTVPLYHKDCRRESDARTNETSMASQPDVCTSSLSKSLSSSDHTDQNAAALPAVFDLKIVLDAPDLPAQLAETDTADPSAQAHPQASNVALYLALTLTHVRSHTVSLYLALTPSRSISHSH